MTDNDWRVTPELLADEVANLAAFVDTGSYRHAPRMSPRELLDAIQALTEAAQARLALARERPVKPRQLAALARVNTERLRQLPRTQEGYIDPRAAREWVSNYVPGTESRELPVTPSWWQQVLPGDKRRRAAEDYVRRELPAGTVLAPEDRLRSIAIGVPAGVTLNDDELKRCQDRIRSALEAMSSEKGR